MTATAPQRCDVLVVGAGPAGSSAAAWLARGAQMWSRRRGGLPLATNPAATA